MLRLGVGAAALASPHVFAQSAQMEEELVFAGDPGITHQLIEREIFPEFARRYGVKKLTYVPSPASENVARLRTQRGRPTIDVIAFAGATMFQAMGENLVAPLDLQRLPNAIAIPEARRADAQMLPYALSTVGLLYNTTIFQQRNFASPTSWWDLWDTKFRGHTGLLTINSTSTVATLAFLSQQLSGDYMNFDAALARLRGLKANVYDFFPSSGPMDTLVQQGELWMWSHIGSRGIQYMNAGFPARFVIPKEGLPGYEACLGVVEGAPHPRVAYAWVNHLLSLEVQEIFATRIGITPMHPGVVVPEALRPYLPRYDQVWIPDWRRLSAALPTIVARWNREVER
ncbi:extracellular solute-binding protein [Humitalea sp. 24SJ18S-53]|uniref:extracellular solute-binding protein n=1 Tax=Humitalea sp. 24SJ18S-53 TaxID=3422307 RepID=UPI003D674B01